MEQTPLPPLVSRDRYADYAAQYTYPTSRAVLRALEKFADLHEAHHAKTREVVQALCDTLAYVTSRNFGDEQARIMFYANGGKSPEKALDLAKSLLQIEPTK